MKRYHLRRHDKEITEKAILEKILKLTKFVTIATCLDNEPYLVSLSHDYDSKAGCIYFHSASSGKKLDYMKANPRVWGQALIDYGYDEGKCTHLYASVMFKGHVQFLTSYEDKRNALVHIAKSIDKNPDKLLPTLKGLETEEALRSTVVGRIIVEEMSGKKSAEISIL